MKRVAAKSRQCASAQNGMTRLPTSLFTRSRSLRLFCCSSNGRKSLKEKVLQTVRGKEKGVKGHHFARVPGLLRTVENAPGPVHCLE